ncbi:MAG: HAMP domain-containing histidine kinase [Bacteroidaceae bacterium]|nr:HAMP domain-containing histidine kinase [Bacteroidaceae bacterium]
MKRRNKWYMLMLIGILAGVSLTFIDCSSSKLTRKDGKPFEVVMVHGYDPLLEDYKETNQLLHDGFEKEGLDVNIHTVYLDLSQVDTTNTRVLAALDSLEVWKPDVLLMDDDFAVYSLLGTFRPILTGLPIVAGGIYLPTWSFFRNFPNMVVMDTPIDFAKNIEICKWLTEKNVIQIELDYTYGDSIFREQLRSSINRAPFIDDTDFHRLDLSIENQQTILKDSLVVLALSLQNPERNFPNDLVPNDSVNGYALTDRLLTYSYNYPQLVVKYDLYGSVLANRCKSPQFTATHIGFGRSNARAVAGYFAPNDVIVGDILEYACDILRGKPVKLLMSYHHEKKFMMDWNAVEKMDDRSYCSYEQWNGLFEIIHAPFDVRHPVLAVVLPIIGLVALLFVIIIITMSLNKKRYFYKQKLLNDLEQERSAENLLLQSVNGSVFIYKDGVLTFANDAYAIRNNVPGNSLTIEQLLERIHPDYREEAFMKLKKFKNSPGLHTIYLYLSHDTTHTEYHWVFMRCMVHDDVIEGFAMEDDITMARNMQLKQAEKQVEDSMEKEAFLNNMSFEVRRPLNSILGFSEILSTNVVEFSEDERKEFYREIHRNSKHLLDLVNDILELSRIQSGRVQLDMSSISVEELMQDLYTEWKDKMKKNVFMTLIQGRSGLMIRCDRYRTVRIFNEWISNSIKYTEKGMISIGWNYDLESNEVSLYVEDTGRGINLADRSTLFQLFRPVSHPNQGVGLGLTISKAIADHMNAKILVQSQLGTGTRFSLVMGG